MRKAHLGIALSAIKRPKAVILSEAKNPNGLPQTNATYPFQLQIKAKLIHTKCVFFRKGRASALPSILLTRRGFSR